LIWVAGQEVLYYVVNGMCNPPQRPGQRRRRDLKKTGFGTIFLSVYEKIKRDELPNGWFKWRGLMQSLAEGKKLSE
jgi:hypothetical protein